jgi:uncharacterized protein
MNQPTTTLIPLQDAERIQSLDVMRGIVLFGILLMNINGFGLPHAYSDPTIAGGATGLNLATWITTNMFFEGTMRGLFSLLFGVGMFIFIDRLVKKGNGINAADVFFRRLTWMLLFGLIHAYLLLWSGEILYDYALMGFLVYSFRNLKPGKLIAIAVILFAIGSAWNYIDHIKNQNMMDNVALAGTYKTQGKEITKEIKASTERWNKIQERRSPEAIREVEQNMRKDYLSVVGYLAPYNMETDTIWTYRYDPWDVLSMMLLGLALYKRNVLSSQRSYKFYGLMVLLGYTIGLLVNYYEVSTIINEKFSYMSFSKTNLTYDVGRVSIAMGHVGAIMLFCKSGVLPWLRRRLAAVGKMALTNYIMHSIICLFFFTGAGLGMFGKLERHELLYVVFSIWAVQLILSPIWLKHFHYGPMEWMWRNLSYQKIQPMKKKLQGETLYVTKEPATTDELVS